MVKVENMKIMTDTGGLKAFVDISIELGIFGSILLKSCRIIKNQTQKGYLLPPQSQYFDADGKKKYYTIARFEGPVKEQIEKSCLAEYERQLRGGDSNALNRKKDRAI